MRGDGAGLRPARVRRRGGGADEAAPGPRALQQGAAGLASALHVSAPRAAQLKHRVACVTCRSRLDGLTSSLAVEAVPRTAAAAKALATETIEESLPLLSDGPLPLAEWLAADSSRGLTPAPRALRDLGALAA
eukprot:CAMPEP_0175312308 /NCGR_PEP_ID=MMETSP0093-20121207/67292_1 /TAXON_ID=311494 /ORGANISM="Alexandrium monilatum, Strain CCMP3105" /LENGTH=132 /DNA_ID=CAMNT_0016608961 /DNA_START=1 /DNA_END=397 /DNA_ORIENTATION=+